MGIALTINTLLESDLPFKYRHGPKVRPGAMERWRPLPWREAFAGVGLSSAGVGSVVLGVREINRGFRS